MRRLDAAWDEDEQQVQESGGSSPSQRQLQQQQRQQRWERRQRQQQKPPPPPQPPEPSANRSTLAENAREAADVPKRDTQYAADTVLHQNTREQVQRLIALGKDVFMEDALELNEDKTQMVEPRAVPVKEQGDWRHVKHLGSLLGTAEDVQHRIGLAEAAFSKFPWLNLKLCFRIELFKVNAWFINHNECAAVQ